MFHHFIIMASLDSKGTRIAYHYVFEKEINDKRIEDDLLNIKNALGCISSISTHSLCLDSDTWEDVVLYDPFFEEVYEAPWISHPYPRFLNPMGF